MADNTKGGSAEVAVPATQDVLASLGYELEWRIARDPTNPRGLLGAIWCTARARSMVWVRGSNTVCGGGAGGGGGSCCAQPARSVARRSDTEATGSGMRTSAAAGR